MKKIICLVLLLSGLISSGIAEAAIIVDHGSVQTFGTIPSQWITQAKSDFHIAYGHTSHGSQIVTGISMLENENSFYSWNDGILAGSLDLDDYAMGGDVGYYPQWVNNTRSYLGIPNEITGRGTGANADVNIIMWSWCGQVSSQTQATMISNYLAPMSQLEADYPGIKFIYMTGHLDGTGETGNLKIRNQQIRDYVNANNKILFDFANIESYDPAGVYYPNANDACPWCTTWCSTHTCPGSDLGCGLTSCAHSHCFNCYQKGKAFWYMMARMAGWDGGTQTDITAPSEPSGLMIR